MTCRFNPTQSAEVIAYDYGPEETNPETGETYREITGIKPGVHIDMHPRTIETHPALAALIVHPENPVHDAGSNVRTWAADEEAYIAAAPPSDPPNPYDLFYEASEPD